MRDDVQVPLLGIPPTGISAVSAAGENWDLAHIS
jgi:hypothetical protein